jgi:hypothetical protein
MRFGTNTAGTLVDGACRPPARNRRRPDFSGTQRLKAGSAPAASMSVITEVKSLGSGKRTFSQRCRAPAGSCLLYDDGR